LIGIFLFSFCLKGSLFGDPKIGLKTKDWFKNQRLAGNGLTLLQLQEKKSKSLEATPDIKLSSPNNPPAVSLDNLTALWTTCRAANP